MILLLFCVELGILEWKDEWDWLYDSEFCLEGGNRLEENICIFGLVVLFVFILDLFISMEIMCDMEGFMDVSDWVYNKVILVICFIFFFGYGLFINKGFSIVKMLFLLCNVYVCIW